MKIKGIRVKLQLKRFIGLVSSTNLLAKNNMNFIQIATTYKDKNYEHKYIYFSFFL